MGHPAGNFEKEEMILNTIRQHLREAKRNQAIGKLTVELEFVRGGVSKGWVGCQVNYRFLENFETV
jgi:hypothetical protein